MDKTESSGFIAGVSSEELAEFFRLLSDPTRLKIIRCLLESSLCVGDIAAALHMEQSAVSHQLRILKSAGAVVFERDGKSVRYYLTDEKIKKILNGTVM